MPITANAKKALRQQKARGSRNKVARAQVRSTVKKAAKSPDAGLLSELFSVVDKAVKKHIIHKNKAARIKSQAVKHAAAPAEKPVAAKAKKKPAVKKTAKKPAKKAAKTAK